MEKIDKAFGMGYRPPAFLSIRLPLTHITYAGGQDATRDAVSAVFIKPVIGQGAEAGLLSHRL
jgi:hypothetical protein